MNSNKLKIAGIIIAIVDIFFVIFFPGIYREAMERRYKDDITTSQATVVSVSFDSVYHRGGKGSRGTTHYVYKILASSEGKTIDLIEHDIAKEKLQIEKNDVINVYCLNDKYAYAPDDFYKMNAILKQAMFAPMFIGVCLVILGSILGKNIK